MARNIGLALLAGSLALAAPAGTEEVAPAASPSVETAGTIAEAEPGPESGLPNWVRKLKPSGSLRLRHEWSLEAGEPHRNRERIQYLLGAETEVARGVTAAFGISSGSDNHRSMNQTLEDAFSKKGLNLNYAYGRFEPAGPVVIYGGKFPNGNVIWTPKDLIWDKDITLEGAGTLVARGPVFLRGGAVVLDEYGKYDPAGGDPFNPRHDSWLYFAQPGVQFGVFGDRIVLRIAAAVYAFDALRHHAPDRPDGSPVTNTTEEWSVTRSGSVHTFDVLKYDYDSVGAGAELSLGGLPGLRLVLFGEAIANLDKSVPGRDRGFLAGGTFGSQRVKDFGHWQVKYGYRELEPDAWPDLFSDSDFHGGATGVFGHEVEVVFGIARNTALGLDYYRTWEQGHSGGKWEQVLQADVSMTF